MKSLFLALALPLSASDPAPFGAFMEVSGHRVHFSCQGQGSSVAVLLHGTPRFSFHFALIQTQIAKFARVCTYDRAGDAWSEPLPEQPKAQQFVDELDQFLNLISPTAPVVLVGHSVGGVLARAYYSLHAGRVSSMVLVDTVAVPAERPSDDALRALLKGRAAQRQPEPTLDGPFAKLPKQFQAAHLWAIRKWNDYAAQVNPLVALQYQADLNHMAAQASRSSVPVWFVARAEPANWVEVQRRLAAFWPESKLILVPDSSHDIQLDQPDALVSAVREAVTTAADRR